MNLLTLLGLILFVLPFFLSSRFGKGADGFIRVLSLVIGFHVIIALITQTFGLFSREGILAIHILLCSVILVNLKKDNFIAIYDHRKSLLMVILPMICVAGLYLFQVHFNYKGVMTILLPRGFVEVNQLTYSYPYFADEWTTVAVMQNVIEQGELPFMNPWTKEVSTFPNLMAVFHATLAEIFVLLNLNPLMHYALFSIFANILQILLIYLVMRKTGARQEASMITALAGLFMTNGANMPGIWYLIPLNIGIIWMLIGIYCLLNKDSEMMFYAALMTAYFYQPLFPFYAGMVLAYFLFTNQLLLREKLRQVQTYLVFVGIVGAIGLTVYYSSGAPITKFIALIGSKLVYLSFTPNAIPQFLLWYIVPVPVLIMAVVGLYPVFKKRYWWLLAGLFLGGVFWGAYHHILYRLIIDYERVVVYTSTLILLTAGLGVEKIFSFIQEKFYPRRTWINRIIQAGIIILFLLILPRYTQINPWKKLILVQKNVEGVLSPAAPANNYLTEEDLRIFDFEGKNFLSHPWKGTVIGTATKNYPLSTKYATITIDPTRYWRFMAADCYRKAELAFEFEADYVYTPYFRCPGFEYMTSSKEGFHLYQVVQSSMF